MTAVELGQLVCVHCGQRLALDERAGRAGGWRPAAVAAIVLLTLGGAAIGLAIGLAADSGDAAAERAAQARAERLELALAAGERRIERLERRVKRQAARARREREAVAGTWPAGVSGYTVVLVTASDEPSARAIADEAKAAGLDAGVLRSDEYGLGQGFWIVYAGRYDTNEQAAQQAARLSERYAGAYPQLVESPS